MHKYCDEYVCVSPSLSLREDISETTRVIFTKCLVHVAYGHGMIYLWRRGRNLLSVIALFYYVPLMLLLVAE